MRKREWDPRSRTLAGILAFVLAPGLIVGGGLWTASYALNRALEESHKSDCRPTSVEGPLQNSFVVNVINAKGEDGAATAIAKELALRDFKPGGVGNDTSARVVFGEGEIRHGREGLDAALVLQKTLFPRGKLVNDYRQGSDVDLVLGPKFERLPAFEGPIVRRTDVVVNVYNTTYYEGLAAKTAAGLTGFGFQQGAVGLDPRRAWVTEIATIRHGPDGEAAAKLLQEAVPGSTLQLRSDLPPLALDLLIGMKWNDLAPADKLTRQEPKKPLTHVTVERPCQKD